MKTTVWDTYYSFYFYHLPRTRVYQTLKRSSSKWCVRLNSEEVGVGSETNLSMSVYLSKLSYHSHKLRIQPQGTAMLTFGKTQRMAGQEPEKGARECWVLRFDHPEAKLLSRWQELDLCPCPGPSLSGVLGILLFTLTGGKVIGRAWNKWCGWHTDRGALKVLAGIFYFSVDTSKC